MSELLIGSYKSGGIGDMCDYIVLLKSVKEKYPNSKLIVYHDLKIFHRIFEKIPWIDKSKYIPPQNKKQFTDKNIFRSHISKFDLFYDFVPYVGKCYKGDEIILDKLPTLYRSDKEVDWNIRWGEYHANPLSQYQNSLIENFPSTDHLKIACMSCDLPEPNWDNLDLGMENTIPKEEYCTFSVSANGTDKGVFQTKQWDYKNWKKFLDMYDLDYPLYQVGIKKEPKLTDNLFWDNPLLESINFLRNSKLHIAIENGTVRLRKLVGGSGVKSLVIYGSTHPNIFGLPGDVPIWTNKCRPCYWSIGNWMTTCFRENSSFNRICTKSVTPEMVYNVMRENI